MGKVLKVREVGDPILEKECEEIEIRKYREHGTWGDAYRKPFLYEYISQEHVKEPFIRMDARRNTKKYIEQ